MNNDGVVMAEENVPLLDEWTSSVGTKWRLVKRDGSVCAEEQDGMGRWWRANDARTSIVAQRLAQVLAEREAAS